MLCEHPHELRHRPLLNVSLLTCGTKQTHLDAAAALNTHCVDRVRETVLASTGLNYAACLEDSSREGGGRSELVIFSSSTPGNFTREQCNSVCFAASHLYGGLGARHECLCSTNSEPNFISESQCSAACTNPQVMKVCGPRFSDCAVRTFRLTSSYCFASCLRNTTFRTPFVMSNQLLETFRMCTNAPSPSRGSFYAEMWLDSGRPCVCGGLHRLTAASPTAKCSWPHQRLCLLLCHSGDAVLGLRRPIISGQHYRHRALHCNSQIWTSRTLRCQSDGLGWTQGGEREKTTWKGYSCTSEQRGILIFCFMFAYFQVSARGEVTMTLPPRLELHCPPLAVANESLEFTLVSWGSVGLDVDWTITKDGVQVAKGEADRLTGCEQLMAPSWATGN